MTFTHPETGELLESREAILAAIKAHEDKMSPLFDVRYKLRTAYLESAEPAEQPAARYRTPAQEKVARCPRCNERLEPVPGCPCRTCCLLRGESEEPPE